MCACDTTLKFMRVTNGLGALALINSLVASHSPTHLVRERPHKFCSDTFFQSFQPVVLNERRDFASSDELGSLAYLRKWLGTSSYLLNFQICLIFYTTGSLSPQRIILPVAITMQCIFKFLARKFNMLACMRRSLCFCRGKNLYVLSLLYSLPKINSNAWKQVWI